MPLVQPKQPFNHIFPELQITSKLLTGCQTERLIHSVIPRHNDGQGTCAENQVFFSLLKLPLPYPKLPEFSKFWNIITNSVIFGVKYY